MAVALLLVAALLAGCRAAPTELSLQSASLSDSNSSASNSLWSDGTSGHSHSAASAAASAASSASLNHSTDTPTGRSSFYSHSFARSTSRSSASSSSNFSLPARGDIPMMHNVPKVEAAASANAFAGFIWPPGAQLPVSVTEEDIDQQQQQVDDDFFQQNQVGEDLHHELLATNDSYRLLPTELPPVAETKNNGQDDAHVTDKSSIYGVIQQEQVTEQDVLQQQQQKEDLSVFAHGNQNRGQHNGETADSKSTEGSDSIIEHESEIAQGSTNINKEAPTADDRLTSTSLLNNAQEELQNTHESPTTNLAPHVIPLEISTEELESQQQESSLEDQQQHEAFGFEDQGSLPFKFDQQKQEGLAFDHQGSLPVELDQHTSSDIFQKETILNNTKEATINERVNIENTSLDDNKAKTENEKSSPTTPAVNLIHSFADIATESSDDLHRPLNQMLPNAQNTDNTSTESSEIEHLTIADDFSGELQQTDAFPPVYQTSDSAESQQFEQLPFSNSEMNQPINRADTPISDDKTQSVDITSRTVSPLTDLPQEQVPALEIVSTSVSNISDQSNRRISEQPWFKIITDSSKLKDFLQKKNEREMQFANNHKFNIQHNIQHTSSSVDDQKNVEINLSKVLSNSNISGSPSLCQGSPCRVTQVRAGTEESDSVLPISTVTQLNKFNLTDLVANLFKPGKCQSSPCPVTRRVILVPTVGQVASDIERHPTLNIDSLQLGSSTRYDAQKLNHTQLIATLLKSVQCQTSPCNVTFNITAAPTQRQEYYVGSQTREGSIVPGVVPVLNDTKLIHSDLLRMLLKPNICPSTRCQLTQQSVGIPSDQMKEDTYLGNSNQKTNEDISELSQQTVLSGKDISGVSNCQGSCKFSSQLPANQQVLKFYFPIHRGMASSYSSASSTSSATSSVSNKLSLPIVVAT